jgi:hypothetical protein
MTESSSDKTKRILLELITKYQWSYQYSIFYIDIDDCTLLIEETNNLKKRLKRKYPNTPFLICYRLHLKGKRVQAYTTIFTPKKINGMLDLVNECFTDHKVAYRKITTEKLDMTARSIKRQALHDLNYFFGFKVRRYQIINRSRMIPKASSPDFSGA